MSSGDERTQNWLLANMGQTDMDAENNPGVPRGLQNITADEEAPTLFETNLPSDDESLSSWEMNRMSPVHLLDDELGPLSIETQPQDLDDRLEASRITSDWINSGGNYTTIADFDSNLIIEGERMMVNPITDTFGYSDLGEHSQASCSEIKGSLGAVLPSAPMCSPVQTSSTVVMSGDTRDGNAYSGICGLSNLGNTCFMASGIQCLFNTPPFAQFFFNHKFESEEENRFSLAVAFSQLIHKSWSGRFSCLQPTEFKAIFGQYYKDFRDNRQHDCQEFVTLLLEALRKQMPVTGDERLELLGGDTIEKRSISSGSGAAESTLSPPSPGSAGSLKNDHRIEDLVSMDSGAASPKSSVSSSSVDAHLISLRLRPIPEEVKNTSRLKGNGSECDFSYSGTLSCHDGESVTSDFSDSCEMGSSLASGVISTAVRQYNALSASSEVCDSNICDKVVPDDTNNCDGTEGHCDTSSPTIPRQNTGSAPNRLPNVKSNSSIVKIEDIIKESKTSNVNVLVKDNPANNKLLFDSEKYAKSDDKRSKKSLDNLTRFGVKRVKEVNVIVNKLDNSVIDHTSNYGPKYNKADDSLNKRIRLDEKNVQYEIAKSKIESQEISDLIRGVSGQSNSEEAADALEHNKLANDNWNNLTADGKSAVVDVFYGQFKSSLVCSICNHTSIRFDPFSTLSVPLPNANEIQIPVTYVQYEGIQPIKCLLTLCKLSTVEDLLKELIKMLQIERKSDIVFAEVFDNHIARILDVTWKTKDINDYRNIYAFDMLPAPVSAEDDIDDESCTAENTVNDKLISEFYNESSSTVDRGVLWKTCNICLEEICCSDLKTHGNCDCILCDACIQMTIDHHGGTRFPCPVCQMSLSIFEMIAVAHKRSENPISRILRIPVIQRIDTESSDNNKREMQLFGHPFLLNLPSRINSMRLINLIRKRFRHTGKFQLLLVDGRGFSCSRCLFSSHCRGCDAVENSFLVLQSSDSLCVRYVTISPDQKSLIDNVVEHPSLADLRQKKPLTIYDCLRQFSQSETLKDSESWFCPKCEKKQQATKTISIWRYPPFLIVHLERFLFHDAQNSKVDDKVVFPIDGLDLSDFVSGSQSSLLYSLYGCVCHFGSAEGGHYTAVVRSPLNKEWHCFNDSIVSRQRPGEEEFSSAYLLFYHHKGLKFDLKLPVTFSFDELPEKLNVSLTESMAIETIADIDYETAVDLPNSSCSPRPRCSPSNVNYNDWNEELPEQEVNITIDTHYEGSS